MAKAGRLVFRRCRHRFPGNPISRQALVRLQTAQPNALTLYQIEQKIAVVLCSALSCRYTLLRFGKPAEIN
jgi:hypothetical protein